MQGTPSIPVNHSKRNTTGNKNGKESEDLPKPRKTMDARNQEPVGRPHKFKGMHHIRSNILLQELIIHHTPQYQREIQPLVEEEVPDIMHSEVRNAIADLRNGRTPGEDGI